MDEEFVAQLRDKFAQSGNSHLFYWFDNGDLEQQEKKDFLAQLAEVNLEHVQNIFQRKSNAEETKLDEIIEPVETIENTMEMDSDTKQSYKMIGKLSILNGEVGVVILAGGQGTRLGFDGPKGMFKIDFPFDKTLFQIFAERIIRLSFLCGCSSSIPLYIMTSPLNDEETRQFFEANNYFELDPKNVIFFSQGTLPCLDKDGKLILENKGKISFAPDGNGSLYPSLFQTRTLNDIKQRGIKYLHVFSVDNAIVRVADPVFIGYCVDKKADVGCKVVWKRDPNEKIGVVVKRNGKYCIIEYSEMERSKCEEIDANGNLVFGAGNICNHFFTVDFIESVIDPNILGCAYHLAKKKIPWINSDGEIVNPISENGVKFELFIFDVFPFAKKMALLSVDREQEFSPIKNASGSSNDTPESALQMLYTQVRQWVINAGGADDEDKINELCGLMPSASYEGEELEQYVHNH